MQQSGETGANRHPGRGGPVEGTVNGFVDTFVPPNTLSGWALQAGRSVPLPIKIYVGDRLIGEGRTGRPRSVSPGDCGFVIKLTEPITLADLVANKIKAYALGVEQIPHPLHIWDRITRSQASSDESTYAIRTNCPVQAWRGSGLIEMPLDLGFRGGPVLTAPEDLPLRHWHFGVVADRFESNLTYNDYLRGTWNYLGPVYHHFGHIMSEFVHRVLPARRIFRYDQWLAVAHHSSSAMTFETCPPVYRDILSVLGIGADNLKIINRDTIVERLNLVRQGAQLGGLPAPAYLEDLREFTSKVLDPQFDKSPSADRVYVSRSKLDRAQGNFLGEACIEAWLADEGFTIFHPQNYSFLEQLQVYRKAQILIFAEGSACHGVELFGPEMLENVCLLSRREGFLELFRRVLAPRALMYKPISASKLLNPIVVLGDPNLISQAFFNLDVLSAQMRDFGVSALSGRDNRHYMACAADDFERHILAHQAQGHELNSERINEIRAVLRPDRASQIQVGPAPRPPPAVLPDLAGTYYIEALQQLHQILAPLTYLEIGTADGASLRLASGTTIAIDPDLTRMQNPMSGKAGCFLFQMPSDRFFEQYNPLRLLETFVDLAFLDGMHLFEYLLHDIINVEKSCGPDSVVLLHDCVPTDTGIAERQNDPELRPQHPNWWAGDVWKVIPILRTWRPDLKITILDANPTGLVVIQGLDPGSTQLKSRYDEICTEWLGVTLASYGIERFHDELIVQSTEAFLSDLSESQATRAEAYQRNG